MLCPKSRMLEFRFPRGKSGDDYDPEMECVSKAHGNGGSQRYVKPGCEQVVHIELKIT